MARLTIEGDELVVGLSPPEMLLAIRGNVRVPVGAVRSVMVDPHPWSAMRGIRLGTSIPGLLFYGTRRHSQGKDFGAMHNRAPVVRVELADGAPFSRLLVSVPDADAAVAAISAAAHI